MIPYFRKHIPLHIVRLACTIVIAVLFIRALSNGNGSHILYCCVTFAFMFLPEFAIYILHLEAPDALSIVYVLLLFAANIMGELIELYITFPVWDSILHVFSGFFLALLGWSLIYRSFSGKPFYAALFAFSFAVMFGVLWEGFEFFMDNVFGYDMQKDTLINSISSVLLDPDGRNISVTRSIDSVVINGETWPGYIDIGLYDTMFDMLLAGLGSLIASVFCWCNEKNQRLFSFIRFFYVNRSR